TLCHPRYLPDALPIYLLPLYQFNTKVAQHYFCSKCGTYTFHRRRSDPNTYGVNVVCLGLNPYHDFPDVAVVDGIHHARDTGEMRDRKSTCLNSSPVKL